MKIAGLTICKNANRFKYPISYNILQHQQLLDTQIIGVPLENQDTDGTVQTIIDSCIKYNIPYYFCNEGDKLQLLSDKDNWITSVAIMRLDWPNDQMAWSIESQDRTLQQYILDNIDFSNFSWICKLDADEFYRDNDCSFLREIIRNMDEYYGNDTNAIAHNYSQFCGSLRHTVYDPTHYVCHIFKPGLAQFAGNDAMQFRTIEGKTMYLDDLSLCHIGYCKDPDLITTRIREHLILNASMYPDAVKNAEKWKDYKFEFPKHKVGAKLWPIGISDQPNETEYKKVDINTLPSVLLKHIEEFDFYVPEFND